MQISNVKTQNYNSIRQLADRIVSCLVDKADPDFHQDDVFNNLAI